MSANAEIIAELRRVLNERDEAREQLDLTKRELGRWVDREAKAVRERDEALARCETLRELADAAAYEQGLAQRRMMDAQRERDEARASLATLEHMLAEERENVDTLRAAVEHAEQRFVDEYDARRDVERQRDELLRVNNGAAQHGIITEHVRKLIELLSIQRQNPTANEAVDAAANEIKTLRTTVEELKARITTLEAMR